MLRTRDPGPHFLEEEHPEELDDEDNGVHRRRTGVDRSNVFRVHRMHRGQISEVEDRYFGTIASPVPPLDG